jgi:hypothetical protein
MLIAQCEAQPSVWVGDVVTHQLEALVTAEVVDVAGARR